MRIREVSDAAGAARIDDMLAEVWGPGHRIASVGLLVALAQTGNYVAVAEDDSGVVGACAGFFHPPADLALHSHLAAVRPGAAGRGIGRALKLHQRDWVLAHGGETVTWTFDPLIARNAHLNLARLGARAVAYDIDLYGAMADERNRGEATDRLRVVWQLLDPAPMPVAAPPPYALVRRDGAGQPIAAALPLAGRCSVAVPDDIESLRVGRPDLAHRWRLVVRDAFATAMGAGWRIAGFDRTIGYVLESKT